MLNKKIIDDGFYKEIESKVNDVNDLKLVLKKIGFTCFANTNITDFKSNSSYFDDISNKNNSEIEIKSNNTKGLQHLLSDKTLDNTEAPVLSFNNKSNPKKWRSVEQNIKSIFENFEDVKCVDDVSKNNVGYDLVVKYSNGNEQYVEVKSVTSLGDSFSMTQNEYATANDNLFKKNYIIVVVEQNEKEIKLSIIDNEKLEQMKFIKRVVKYEWVSDSAYSGKYLTFDLEK